jgi:hypothetical protein
MSKDKTVEELEEIRGTLMTLYDESRTKALLRVGSPIHHMVDGAMEVIIKLLAQERAKADIAGRIAELENIKTYIDVSDDETAELINYRIAELKALRSK